jgi:hypothetical protein
MSEKQRLFQYAIIFHPRQTKSDKDKGSRAKSVMVTEGVITVLAADEAEVQVLAARVIPEKYIDKLDCVEIALRPF